jgi:hypothetical protein
MCCIKCSLSTLALIFLGLGCSAKGSKTNGDASAGSAEAGRGIDARLDVAKAGIDSGGSDARDAADAGIDRGGVTDARDSRVVDVGAQDVGASPLDSAGTGDARDGSDARSDAPDAALDAPGTDAKDGGKDGTKDAAGEVRVDAALPRGTCESPIPISSAVVHSDLKGSTLGADHILDLPCASNGSDLVFSFLLFQREMVYADTFGTTWNTVISFSDSCSEAVLPTDDGMAACNDDACGTSQSQAYALLDYGLHYLIVSGVNDESGDVVLHFEHAQIGSGPLATLPQELNSVQGTTGGTGIMSLCEASGAENTYWWLGCPDYEGGAFHASTCAGTSFDTVLSLQTPRIQALSCNDDDNSCGQQSTIDTTIPPGAGINVLTVDGLAPSNSGKYTLNYTRP